MLPIGFWGKWGSGKSHGARHIIRLLGGLNCVLFSSDRREFARAARDHLLDDGFSIESVNEHGLVPLVGTHATVFLEPRDSLNPEEKLASVNLELVKFYVHDNVCPDSAREKMARQLREWASDTSSLPCIMEVAIGPNANPKGENPFIQTFEYTVQRYAQEGVRPEHLRIVIPDASLGRRWQRNLDRDDPVSWEAFNQFAGEGGGLTPELEQRLIAEGAQIISIDNDHDVPSDYEGEVVLVAEALGLEGIRGRGVEGGAPLFLRKEC